MFLFAPYINQQQQHPWVDLEFVTPTSIAYPELTACCSSIPLLRRLSNYQIVAFSCAPTSSDCVVFTVKHVSPTVMAISTCYPGATEWTTASFLSSHARTDLHIWNNEKQCLASTLISCSHVLVPCATFFIN